MIYIIATACINDRYGLEHNIVRQLRYLNSINSLLNLTKDNNQFKVIVVENNGKRETYLDQLECDVVYTDNNKMSFSHKGYNELADIKHIIETYHIQDDDVVIKITGRYRLLTNKFLEIVEQQKDNFDAFLKFFNVCTRQYVLDDCVLGLYAIKTKYIKNFNYDGIKSPEIEFATYVRKTCNNRIAEMANLGLECCFGESLITLIV